MDVDIGAWIGKIEQAQSIAHLDALEKESQALEVTIGRLLGLTIREKRDKLIATQRLNGATERLNGSYLVDAQNIFYLGEPDGNEPRPDEAFGLIRRKRTPGFYQKLVDDATAAWKKGQKPNLNSAGTSEEYDPGETDAFNNSGPVKAHGLPDSYTCLPSYGKMVEGATGPISEGDTHVIRLLRALGSKNQPKAGLRTHKKNFLSLPSDHRRYFDTQPQVVFVPMLPLDKIVNYDGEEYDVAVLVMSATDAEENQEKVDEVERVYQKVMKSFDWVDFPETPGEDTPGLCSKVELEGVFSVLRVFIAANAYSLHEGDPQALTDLARYFENKKSGTGSASSGGTNSSKSSKSSKGGKKKKKGLPPLSPRLVGDDDEENESVSQGASEEGSNSSKKNKWELKKAELELAKKIIYDDGLKLPKLIDFGDGPLPKVLKVAVRIGANEDSGRCVPDPWLLMVKAAVNFSYCAYGHKLLPACVPDIDTSGEQNGKALSAESQHGIDFPPLEVIIPATTSDHVAATPPAGASGRKTTRRCEEQWETLSDASTVVSESPAVVTPSHGEDRGNYFEQEKCDALSTSSN